MCECVCVCECAGEAEGRGQGAEGEGEVGYVTCVTGGRGTWGLGGHIETWDWQALKNGKHIYIYSIFK